MQKRRYPRRHLVYYLRVFDVDSHKPIGHSVDHTPEGIMLISDDPIATDKVYHLKMILPAKIMKKKVLAFDAKSLWCRKDVNSDFFDTGFKLLNVTPKKSEIIKGLIEDFGMRD